MIYLWYRIFKINIWGITENLKKLKQYCRKLQRFEQCSILKHISRTYFVPFSEIEDMQVKYKMKELLGGGCI